MKKTFRTFVAVEISAAIRARADELIAKLDGTTADVKWVEPHNLHLTLKFLGEVHEREIAEVCRAVAAGRGRSRSVRLGSPRRGAFPTAARPRTVWLGAGAGAEQMVVLHDRVEAALAETGLPRRAPPLSNPLDHRPRPRQRAGHRGTGKTPRRSTPTSPSAA